MKKGPFKMKGMTFKSSPAKISESELLGAAKSEALARTSAKVQKGKADSRKTRLFGLQAALAGIESAVPGLDKIKKKKPKKEETNPYGYDPEKGKGEEIGTPKVTEGTDLTVIETEMPEGSAMSMRKQDTVFPMKYGNRSKKKK